MGDAKDKQLPPVRVSTSALDDIETRAQACGLTLSEYIRYRCYGKKVLTGEQLEVVKKNEKPVD